MIVIDPHMNCTSMLGDVVFPTQWCGIEYEGTAYRMDHVPIMLRKVVEPPKGILNDEQILEKILAEVKAIKAQKAGQVPPPETHPKTGAKSKKEAEAN